MSDNTAPDLTAWLDEEAATATPDPTPTPEATAETAATPDPEATPAEGSSGVEAQAATTDDGVKPEHRVPLPEHLDLRRKHQEAKAELAKRDQDAAAANDRHRLELLNREHDTILRLEGPEAAAEFAREQNAILDGEAERQGLVEATRSEAGQAAAWGQLQLSEAYAKDAYGENRYLAAFEGLKAKFGEGWLLDKAADHPKGVGFVVDFFEKEIAQDPATVEKRIEAEAEKRAQSRLAELLKLNKTGAVKPDQSAFAQAGGASPNSEPSWMGKDPEDMTTSELKQASAAERAKRLKSG